MKVTEERRNWSKIESKQENKRNKGTISCVKILVSYMETMEAVDHQVCCACRLDKRRRKLRH